MRNYPSYWLKAVKALSKKDKNIEKRNNKALIGSAEVRKRPPK